MLKKVSSDSATLPSLSSLPLEAPIVVIGDRSASMDVAIRTSTIMASILTAISHARLVFFNTENMEISSEQMPCNVDSVSLYWKGP